MTISDNKRHWQIFPEKFVNKKGEIKWITLIKTQFCSSLFLSYLHIFRIVVAIVGVITHMS